MKWVARVVVGLVGVAALIALAFALELGGLQWARFFRPKHEDVRRDVFKRTRSYNEAKTQDLAKLRLQYMSANDDGKEALASTIRHMFADYDRSLLPAELSSFLLNVRGY